MNLDKFTLKSQEAIQQAQQIAVGLGSQNIESGHILKAILEVDENVAPFLFKKLNVNLPIFKQALDKILERYPKVDNATGQYLSADANQALIKANTYLKEFKDEYVSVEHLLLGLLTTKDVIGQLMKDNGMTEKDLKKAITDLRKGSTVTSSGSEETYNALNKYAIDLCALAQAGKMDPVIGRDDEIRRVLQILSRRTKHNPILVGEPGVGKTALAEGLVTRIVNAK